MIKLNQSQQEALLKHYGELEMSIKPEEECLIGAGYTHCKDLGFSAVKLFDALMPEIISE